MLLYPGLAAPLTAQPTRITTLTELTRFRAELVARGATLGLVPTMGYLHTGHLSLVRVAREHTDAVVVSIYVNPTQFGPGEDLARYPRDLARDLASLAALDVDGVFTPEDDLMYPPGFATDVRVRGLTDGLCGRYRPVHFGGVATIVTKLFNLVRPDVAVFGQKDYQQLVVIRRLVRDLNLNIEIVGAPTVREPDGLAMSSRNAYLTPAQRASAPAIYAALQLARERFDAGERDAAVLLAAARERIERDGQLTVQYLELVDPDDLHALPEAPGAPLPGRVHAAAAVFAGETRLIDNLRLGG